MIRSLLLSVVLLLVVSCSSNKETTIMQVVDKPVEMQIPISIAINTEVFVYQNNVLHAAVKSKGSYTRQDTIVLDSGVMAHAVIYCDQFTNVVEKDTMVNGSLKFWKFGN